MLSTFEDVILALLGALLVFGVLYDVFQTVILPRWASRFGRVGPLVIRSVWQVWTRVAWRLNDPEKREDFLGAYAPFSLILVLITWLSCSIIGYGALLHAFRNGMKPHLVTWSDSFYTAGVSLLTIGFGDFVGVSPVTRAVLLMAAASGLTIVALVISWTFTLYTSFNKREVMVVMLDQRAGAPPSGVTLLQTYAALGMRENLPNLFEKWEEWAADVLESHIAYPILPFFRSSHDSEAWVSALGAVADAATLLTTTVEEPGCGYAKLMQKMATHTLTDICNYFGLHMEDDGQPHPGVERREWETARRSLEKAGYKLRPEEEGWRRFVEVRSSYADNLNMMARFLSTPPTQWIGDRSQVKHRPRHEHRTGQEAQKRDDPDLHHEARTAPSATQGLASEGTHHPPLTEHPGQAT